MAPTEGITVDDDVLDLLGIAARLTRRKTVPALDLRHPWWYWDRLLEVADGPRPEPWRPVRAGLDDLAQGAAAAYAAHLVEVAGDVSLQGGDVAGFLERAVSEWCGNEPRVFHLPPRVPRPVPEPPEPFSVDAAAAWASGALVFAHARATVADQDLADQLGRAGAVLAGAAVESERATRG